MFATFHKASIPDRVKLAFRQTFLGASWKWTAQDPSSKFLMLIALLCIFFGYLPTLQFDYVTQDQWRAFRYSTLAQTASYRAKACTHMIPEFYADTGRPLVWIGECVEHTAVAKISDLRYLRPFVLALVIATVIYLGSVLSPLVGGWAMGTLAAAAFVMAPGYSFMYLQGATAAMVLITIILAAGSFRSLRKWLDSAVTFRRRSFFKLWFPCLLFLLACLTYPEWAFVVVPLAWVAFGFDYERSLSDGVTDLIFTLLLYLIVALVYYALVKLLMFILVRESYALSLGAYTVTMELKPVIVWQRVMTAAARFYRVSPLNFVTPRGVLVATLLVFSANIGWQRWRHQKIDALPATILATLCFLFGCVVLLGSISPWLFSQMPPLPTRYLIPWYMFFCVAAVGLVFHVAKALFSRFHILAPVIVLIALVGPATAFENRLTFLEVATSTIEVQYLHSKLNQWLDEDGWLNHRYLLFVLPRELRPVLITQLLGHAYPGENVVLTTSQNPVSVPWMVNAVLRERHDHPVGKSVDLVDCAFDQACANAAISDKAKVAIEMTYGEEPIKTDQQPFVINFTTLTSRVVRPVIVRANMRGINASPQTEN